MNLGIDLGNTLAKFYLFDEENHSSAKGKLLFFESNTDVLISENSDISATIYADVKVATKS